MTNILESFPIQWSKMAKATRWLFWIMLVYVVLWWSMDTLRSAFYPMNPQARASLWGKIRWYAPSYFMLICELVTLYFLFFIQSALNKGVARADENKIKQGSDYLTRLFWVLAFLLPIKLLFEWLILPNWWSWEF